MSNQDMGRGIFNLKNLSKINSEVAIDEVEALISEMNNYIAEIQYGLEASNEKISMVIIELYELKKILTKYLEHLDHIKILLENSNESINEVSVELLEVRQLATTFSNKVEERHKNIEKKTNILKKRLTYLTSLISAFNKSHEFIERELNIIEILVYVVILMSFVGVFINFNKLF
ncbi:conserved hypothetical protein [Methanocaldococcus vulcanius M7]|uniref:Uncharacterized protein n=1 Tax=Methanocaldococcus vulcanius (strain ATCC 700851 / DSM 12094 / M7) TaxID=579137 RepID=C9RIE4_METVM|nr:hypothetical protein [Methanocaldococcus vulcanius]ACX73346.1 conserved hypothetical protein [Methanocaldococcus vulcanius M7]